MKPSLDSPIRDFWVIAAIAVGVALRFVNLGDAALWHDEIFTAVWVADDWGGLLHEVMTDNHLPLYPIVLKAWSMIAGDSATALRLPSLFVSIAAIPFTAALGAVVAGVNAARVAAWIAAVSPFFVHHGQEARMYSFVQFFAAISLWLLVRYLRGGSPRLGIGFVLCNVAMLCTHYYALFFVATEVGILALYGLFIDRREPRTWMPAAVACALAIAGLVGMALIAPTLSAGQSYGVGLLALPGVAWSMLYGYILMPASEQLHAQGLDALKPYTVYLAVAAFPTMAVVVAGLRSLDRDGLAVTVLILTGVVLGPFAVSFIFPRISVNPRYFIAGAPAMTVLVATGILASRHTAMRLAAAVVLGMMVYATGVHLVNPGQKRSDVPAAGRWLDEHVAVDTEMLITSNEMYTMARYHWPDRPLVLYPDHRTVVDQDNAAEVVANIPLKGRKRLYYMFGRSWLNDPQGRLQEALAERFALCEGTEVRGIRIYCLEPR